MTGAFSAATAVRVVGDGEYTAELSPQWSAGGRAHGGYLLAVVARAALQTAGAADPLAISAQFLRSPEFGSVTVRTELRKKGRTVTALTAVLEQDGQPCIDAHISAGSLPGGSPLWSELPDLPAEPPADAHDVAEQTGSNFGLASMCELRLDAASAGFVSGRVDLPPRLLLWARPADEPPDPLFALLTGDVSPPVVYNLGRLGWAPTVQLTALLRARPAAGWLRVQAECRAVHGSWFDEDLLIIDSAGRLVCQARQLAIAPR